MHEHEEAPGSVAHLLDHDGFVERLARHVVHRTYRTVAERPPRGVTKAALASFRAREQDHVIEGLARLMQPYAGAIRKRLGQRTITDVTELPDAMTALERTEANLHAMTIMARGAPYTDIERLQLRRYTGWGGLTLAKVAKRFPDSFPVPERRALVHEYYTQERVWKAALEAAHRVRLIPEGPIRGLEPSAGIGRALGASSSVLGDRVRWTAVEASEVSRRMLDALYPSAEVVPGFFESYAARVASRGQRLFHLVVANPPYGARGEAMEQDPDGYRTKRAYIYFVLRSIELLKTGGVGLYIVPTGLMTGTSAEYIKHRRELLKRAHVVGAWRLPSQSPDGGGPHDYVYDQFVTDLIMVQARGGQAPGIHPEDQGIVQGQYFAQNPTHVLGEGVGEASTNWEPGMRKARRGFQLVGRFRGVPDFAPRPFLALEVDDKLVGSSRGGVARDTTRVEGLVPHLDEAQRLGFRVDTFLADLAAGRPEAVAAWSELHHDLLGWSHDHGNPYDDKKLRALAADRVLGAQRFLAAFDQHTGQLVSALSSEPQISASGYEGEPQVLQVAEWLYRRLHGLRKVDLTRFWSERFGVPLPPSALDELLEAGWCLDGDSWSSLVPGSVYATGYLWPKLDRAERALRNGWRNAKKQVANLRSTIGFADWSVVAEGIRPTHDWLPIQHVRAFLRHLTGQDVELEREDGVLRPAGIAYRSLNNTDKARSPGFHRATLSFLGWANFDKRLWKPVQEKQPDPSNPAKEKREPLADARRRYETEVTDKFREWVEVNADVREELTTTYNRRLRGFVPIPDDTAPLSIARWKRGPGAIVPRPWQNAGARRMVDNRAGLLAFDVGLGKTYTALMILALARQMGWMRRPVVLAPNSIVWKWYRDFARVLPDFKVEVIGSRRIRDRKTGRVKAITDTPKQRAEKWTRVQAGEVDAVILTYSALARTQMDRDFVEDYASRTASLRRAIALSIERQKAEAGEEVTETHKSERAAADAEERQRAWIGDMLAPSKGQKFDPGIDWHQLGIDGLFVDEAQNFKNLFHTAREKTSAKDTKRAWALDFRCASVRHHTGGSGVFLLSATPAKNSPVEWFNLLHMVNPKLMEEGLAVDNPEEFVARFGDFRKMDVPDPSGTKIVERDVCVGLKNVDQLRNVMDRWAVFRTAEMVGLKLPMATVQSHTVDLSDRQRDLTRTLFRELAGIEDKLVKLAGAAAGGHTASQKAYQALIRKKTTLAMTLYLVYLHPGLPKGQAAGTPADGPKLVACADQILATSSRSCSTDKAECCFDCGHIVFVDNIKVHHWMRDLLVERGVDPARIAILNAEDTKDIELRQQIAEAFNGSGCPGDDDHIPPQYDIVIANQVAYEGMDLQRRTCAIHHLDVPWEPATLQQRNGRGVRQGNTFGDVSLHYYFVRGSNESWKVSKLQRKRGWMDDLFEGAARATNTTQEANEEDLNSIERFLANADPETAASIRASIAERKRQEEERARVVGQFALSRTVNELNRQWRLYEREPDQSARIARYEQVRRKTDELVQRVAASTSEGTSVYPDVPDLAERIARLEEVPVRCTKRSPPLVQGERVFLERYGLVEVGAFGLIPESDVLRSVGWDRAKARKLGKKVRGLWLREHGEPEAKLWVNQTADLFEEGVDLAPEWPDESVDWDIGAYNGLRSLHEQAMRLAEPARSHLWNESVEASIANGLHWRFDVELPVILANGRAGLVPSTAKVLPPGSRLLAPNRDGWVLWVDACRASVSAEVKTSSRVLCDIRRDFQQVYVPLRRLGRRWWKRVLTIDSVMPAAWTPLAFDASDLKAVKATPNSTLAQESGA